MRWQVDGYLAAVPNASYEQVHSRFVAGSGIHGADVRAMLKNLSWDEQKERFAEVILTNAFAIYESWAKQIIARCPASGFTDRDLSIRGNGKSSGLSAYIAAANAAPSVLMTKGFKPKFVKHKKYFPAVLDNMVLCYRYFKELRNCQMHNGGMTGKKALEAFSNYAPVSSAASMKTKETIEHFPLIVGTPAKVTIRGVVGFCDVLLRLMVTVDVELSGSMMAEAAALERLRARRGHMLTLGADKLSIAQKIRKICVTSDLPEPSDGDVVREFFLEKRIAGR